MAREATDLSHVPDGLTVRGSDDNDEEEDDDRNDENEDDKEGEGDGYSE